MARLKHPNIIQILAISERERHPFLSLEYAEGGNLAQKLAVEVMVPQAAAGLVASLACAVQFAHQAGVVHRDIKPTNVLLAADGTPKLSDFGLAKLLDADSTLTGTGQPIGTPSYMAPEQARGGRKKWGRPRTFTAWGRSFTTRSPAGRRLSAGRPWRP